MKNLISLLLCVLLVTTMLAACGDDSTAKDTSTHDEPENHISSPLDSVDSPNSSLNSTTSNTTTSNTTSTSHSDHNHGTTTPVEEQVKYQIYTNADKTYRVVFRDIAGKVVAEFDKLMQIPLKTAVNTEKGIYELGWATGSGPNDFYCVYYNVHTGAVSKLFHAPRGTDGVRIAYGSEDQTKIIVADVFSTGSYYKEYPLENAYTEGEYIIIGGTLKVDKKTVVISYITDEKGTSQHTTVKLYE